MTSSSSVSCTANRIRRFVVTSRPSHTTTKWRSVAISASSTRCRCSRRRSRSPTQGRTASRSSPSVAGGRRLTSSKPRRHTTLAGTFRTGTIPVIVTRPLRSDSRPGSPATRPSTKLRTSDQSSIASTDVPATTARPRSSSIARSTSAICHASAGAVEHSSPSVSTRTVLQCSTDPVPAARSRTRRSLATSSANRPALATSSVPMSSWGTMPANATARRWGRRGGAEQQ